MSHDPSVNRRAGRPDADLACSAVRPRLLDLLDGSLDEAQTWTLQGHLQTCLPCRREYEALHTAEQALVSVQRSLPSAGDLRPDFHARLAARSVPWQFSPAFLRFAVPALVAGALFVGWGRGFYSAPRPVTGHVFPAPAQPAALPQSASNSSGMIAENSDAEALQSLPSFPFHRPALRDAASGRKGEDMKVAIATPFVKNRIRNGTENSVMKAGIAPMQSKSTSNNSLAFHPKFRSSSLKVPMDSSPRFSPRIAMALPETGVSLAVSTSELSKAVPRQELPSDSIQATQEPIQEVVDVHVTDTKRHFAASLKVEGNHCSVTDASTDTATDGFRDSSEDANGRSESSAPTESGEAQPAEQP